MSLAPGTCAGPSGITVQIRANERRVLVRGGAHARYLPSGHLVYARGGTVLAVPFDSSRLEVTGSAVPVIENVRRSTSGSATGAAHFSVSNNGSLVFVPRAIENEFRLSNESGRDEVYGQPFPGPGGKIPISTDGGNAPVWARSGKALFYRNGDKMMVVDITTEPGLAAGGPRLLFERRFDPFGSLANFDVTPDGQRFVMIPEGPDSRTRFYVVLNWFEELKRLVPTEFASR